MPLPSSLDGVQLEMEGRTAIIRGQVASEADVQLAERLLSLEPGIDSVRNELVVLNETGELVPRPNSVP
ncbi:MAG: BON domain-containing protein [Planctomycetales bacterium]|nr:BON domain-containing protein [Planctomycetales bacterium]